MKGNYNDIRSTGSEHQPFTQPEEVHRLHLRGWVLPLRPQGGDQSHCQEALRGYEGAQGSEDQGDVLRGEVDFAMVTGLPILVSRSSSERSKR